MDTLAPNKVVSPFAKINVWREADGSKRVRAYILVERAFEQTKTGLAIDGSASMRPSYGYPTGFMGLWATKQSRPNLVTPEARRLGGYLAAYLDVDSRASVIYWGTGRRSREIVDVGDMTEADFGSRDFDGPTTFGGGATELLPAIRHFTDRFSTAPMGIYVFVTDGVISDLKPVMDYTTLLAQRIEAGSRSPLKFVIIGVGDQVDETQMIALDNLDTGTSLDLWDHKLAKDMSEVAEIGVELVNEKVILAPNGVIRDAAGHVAKDYRDTGLPALLEFKLPANASSAFMLEFGGQVIRQPLP